MHDGTSVAVPPPPSPGHHCDCGTGVNTVPPTGHGRLPRLAPRTLVGRAIPSGVQPSSLYACLLNAIQVAPGLGHSLIYISLINDIQHLFRCLFAIYLSLVKCKFKGLLPLFYLGACLYNSRNYRIIGF